MKPERIQEDLGRRWRPALLAYFMRRVRDHAEAEDLTQELLMRLVQRDTSEVASHEGYVFQMAANLLSDRSRRYKVRASYRESVMRSLDRDVDILDPHRISVGRAQLAVIARTLDALPERTRTIFILYRIESFGQDAIAETYGISTSAVKKHVARAMTALSQTLEVAE